MSVVFHFLLAIASVPTNLLMTHGSDVDVVDVRQFVIDFDTEVANDFYPRSPSKKLRMLRNSLRDVDAAANRKVCESILASTFNIHQIDSRDETALLPLSLRSKYRPKVIAVFNGVGGAAHDEEVFLCSALDDSHYIRKLYVSRLYNLNADGDIDASKGYIGGRFIFRHPGLYGLAEFPGKNFVCPEHDVEHIYLERRGETDLSKKKGYDELCKQDKNEQRRICTAVFASGYFEDRAPLFLGTGAIERECQLEVVSFQTDYGANKAAKRLYREWMLPCNANKEDENFDYLLSHAYKSNQIFVFQRDVTTRAVFLKNLIVDVRIRVESHRKKNAAPDDTVFLDDQDI